jgi:hypothetical protein
MSQVWGIVLKEWRGAAKESLSLNWASIAVICAAVLLLGVASSL